MQISLRSSLLILALFGIGFGIAVHRPLAVMQAEERLAAKGIVIELTAPEMSHFQKAWRRKSVDVAFDYPKALPLKSMTDLSFLRCALYINFNCNYTTNGQAQVAAPPVYVTDGDIEKLLECGDWITSLRLHGPKITDRGLRAIAKMPNLEFLVLDGSPITDAGMHELRVLTKLVSVELSDTQVRWHFEVGPSDFEYLDQICLNGSAVDERTLIELAKCKRLTSLSLEFNELAAGTLGALRRIPLLTELQIRGVALQDQDWRTLVQLRQLTSLNLTDTNLDDAHALLLLQLPQLRMLFVPEGQISSQTAKVFENKGTSVIYGGNYFASEVE